MHGLEVTMCHVHLVAITNCSYHLLEQPSGFLHAKSRVCSVAASGCELHAADYHNNNRHEAQTSCVN